MKEILIYGEIGTDVTAKEVIEQLNAIDAPEIRIRINSDGGSVSQGAAIYKAIKNHPASITTSIEGGAFSIAGYIAMAGTEREIASNGMLMIHGPRTATQGNEAEHEQTLQMLKAATTSMVGAYAEATGESEDEIREMLKSDNWFSADEALARGFVTRIAGESQIAANTAKFSNIPKRFADAIRDTKQETQIMSATFVRELRAGCPGASAEFIMLQAEKEATITDAQAEYMKALAEENAQLKAKLAAMEEEEKEEEMTAKEENAALKAKLSAMEEGSDEEEKEEEKPAAKAGAKAVKNVTAGTKRNATDLWDTKIQALIDKNVPRAKAVSIVNKKNIGLRQEMMAEKAAR